MNSKIYARLVLLLPFLSLTESIGYFVFRGTSFEKATLVDTINIFWDFAAVFWIIPYTTLSIYLLLWSRKKTVEQIQACFGHAPVAMVYLSGGFYLLLASASFVLGAIGTEPNYYEGVGFFLAIALASVLASFVIGYIFVGLALLLYWELQRIRFVRD